MMCVTSMVALLDAILMILLPCSAFTADRPVIVPGWNIVPLLETGQEATVDHSPNGNTQVTSFDKVTQASDTNKTTQSTEQNISQDTEHDKRDFVSEVVEDDTRFAKIVKDTVTNSAKQTTGSVVTSPRNVILLLVEESDQDQKDLWKDFRASRSFPVEGYLQSCHNPKVVATRFFLDRALIGGRTDTECDCERYLQSNVATLLLWARDVRGMTTGTLLNTNFTIPPSLFRYEEPINVPMESDELDENMKLNIRRAKPEIRGDWFTIDLGKPANRVPAVPFSPNNREDGSEDSAWNVFDMFSRIRTALFRSLLESLGRNAGSEESIPYGRSHPLWSNLANIVSELKSIQNQNGFILVAATPASELNSAMAILQREMSQDMLIVVTGLCKDDTKPIPFFANGPAARSLHDATFIWDLPRLVRTIIAGGCQDASCRIRRHDTNLPPASQPLTAPLNENISKNASEVAGKVVQVNGSNTNISNAATNATANAEDEQIKEVMPIMKSETMEEKSNKIKESPPSNTENRSSANSNMKTAEFCTILGTIISIFISFNLAS